MGCDDADRRLALLLPLLERVHHVESVGAFAAAAMAHAGDHEEADGIRRIRRSGTCATGRVKRGFVVIDAGARCDTWISPAVIHQQLSTASEERSQIRI